jgi:hypothetical protein
VLAVAQTLLNELFYFIPVITMHYRFVDNELNRSVSRVNLWQRRRRRKDGDQTARTQRSVQHNFTAASTQMAN